MEELEKLVAGLTELSGENVKKDLEDPNNPIVKQLQLIGREFLINYEIKIGDLTVEPIWVEAYYSNKAQNFVEPSIHGKDAQKNNFGELYFHHNTDDQRSGVDICLSSSEEYYLSYLLKYTLVKGEFTTQAELSKKIRTAYAALGKNPSVLCRKDKQSSEDIIGYTERIGLKANDSEDDKSKYKKLDLAIAKNFDKNYAKTKKLPQIEKLADSYLSTYTGCKEEECKRILGYCRSQYKGI